MTQIIAQCVMCFRSAAAQQAERSRVLNDGILILLIPPFLIIAAIAIRLWTGAITEPRPQRSSDRARRRPDTPSADTPPPARPPL